MRLFEITIVAAVLAVALGWRSATPTTLDSAGNYELFWDFNDTDIVFEVRVRTRGYVGFGISRNGDMYPADVIVGWVKDGRTYFKDRHTVGHVPPVVDASQDWFLLHGEENDFGTVLRFTRKLDTCDVNDTVINDGTVRVIYSYHPDDPTSETAILPYHGATRRGTKSLSLLTPNIRTAKKPNVVRTFDFFNHNFMIPDQHTTYQCTGFLMPQIGKHHIIKVEPVISPGNELFVHHILVYRCTGIPSKYDGVSYTCYENRPKDAPICNSVFLAWAVGGDGFYFPEHAGLSVGAPDDPAFYVMETHYDNPSLQAGIIDSSGLRITITPELRQFEAGTLSFGHSVVWRQVVPPEERSFITYAYCDKRCVDMGLNQGNMTEVKAFAIMQHSHLLGRAIRTRHFRNGSEITPLMDDPNYDFNFQQTRLFNKEVPIRHGDSFIVDCVYDSIGKTVPTMGGLSTRDEMCLTFVYYYPRMSLEGCTSKTSLDAYGLSGIALYNEIKQLNWTDPLVKQDFKHKLDQSTVSHHCSGPKLNPPSIHYKYVEPPTLYKPRPSTCNGH